MFKRKIIAGLLISCLAALNINFAVAEEQTSSKGFFAFLAPMLIDTMKQLVTNVVQQGSNTLFNSINSIGSSVTANNSSQPVQQYNSVATPTIINPQQVQTLSKQPLLAITVTKYASKDINSPALEVIKFPESTNLQFSIFTGEAFAIKFDTSLPGRVTIKNVDANGRVDGPWNYDVIGAAENRLPKTNNIVMFGAPGLENLEIQFTPCVSPTLMNDSRVSPYINTLPMCSTNSQASNSHFKSMQRVVKTKSMSNEELQVNPSVVLMAAQPDAPVGTAQIFKVYVNHQSPSYNVPVQQTSVPGV